jgi:hypothetical protein
MMRGRAWLQNACLIASAALAVCGAYQAIKLGRTSIVLSRILAGEYPGDGLRFDRRTLVARGQDFTGEAMSDLHEGTAVLLVYDVACSVCNENVPRWLDLVVEARRAMPGVRFFAVATRPDSAGRHAAYWAGFDNIITPLAVADTATVRRLTGVVMTPATVVVRNGRSVATHVGYLGERRRQFLLSQLSD